MVDNVSAGGAGQGTGSEVAVFVDFENIRYSTINSFGREPDPLTWRDKALKYGLMAIARAYADFEQHPPPVRNRLDVAGFEAQHYPAKRTIDQQGREKIVSRSDLNFAIDIINTALGRPDIKTFLLFTAAQQSNVLTPWVSEGTSYILWLRPLLPDETGCPPRQPETATPEASA